jgi:hypothetical protein
MAKEKDLNHHKLVAVAGDTAWHFHTPTGTLRPSKCSLWLLLSLVSHVPADILYETATSIRFKAHAPRELQTSSDISLDLVSCRLQQSAK